ncbi:antibiotic biosynthesis monooxygenase [Pasteurellaceae bacterium LIM206]|nr:antibiotic biosynthesis monooxygenase [Pasteurellaceae bacterium LIM206]
MKFRTLLTVSLLMLSTNLFAQPIFNLFELGVKNESRYNRIGAKNIEQSLAAEQGTLAMYSVRKADDGLHYMVEIYADEQAYQIHLQSPQYKAFLNAAPEILTDHKLKIALNPQFLGDKKIIPTAETITNLVMVDVKPEFAGAFKKIVTEEMRQSLAVEPNVLAMYAATVADNPNRWMFFEIYTNDKAYRLHRQTPHFQAYLINTAQMSADKRFIAVEPVMLKNKGNLNFLFNN